jgi:1,4-alpha-glucan branching enzyme
VAVCNFTPVVRQGYRIGVPRDGYYREILNTDSRYYGGSDVGNGGGLRAEPTPAHGYAQSLSLTLPPLATVLLQPA